MEEKIYDNYIAILKEELIPAMGCTEPIAVAYCAAKCRQVFPYPIEKVLVEASGNIIKNVKSVIVPNTNKLKGIEASAAAGIVAGDASKALEVIANVTDEQKQKMKEFLVTTPITVRPADSEEQLDIIVTLYYQEHFAKVRIASTHTNIVLIQLDNEILFEAGHESTTDVQMTDRSLLNLKDIVEFANTVDIDRVKDILDRQIEYNSAIAREGIENDWGANIGSVLLNVYGDDIKIRAKAMAAAGSDARMSGCELPVVINSGSGNQGMTASLPVIEYAKELNSSKEQLYRALCISNLATIHQKTGIGRLSAYCGAVSAGCGAGCGIAYLLGADYKGISHTLVNAVAIVSGIICDGAKPSCAGKISAAVDAGIFGYQMYLQGQQFKGGDGIILKGVENTIHNIGRLGKEGMKETDKEIIKMMTGC